jgi:hypothetical protein
VNVVAGHVLVGVHGPMVIVDERDPTHPRLLDRTVDNFRWRAVARQAPGGRAAVLRAGSVELVDLP